MNARGVMFDMGKRFTQRIFGYTWLYLVGNLLIGAIFIVDLLKIITINFN